VFALTLNRVNESPCALGRLHAYGRVTDVLQLVLEITNVLHI